MKVILPILAVLLFSLTACQSIPPERTNNCACAWGKMNGWTKTGAPDQGVLS